MEEKLPYAADPTERIVIVVLALIGAAGTTWLAQSEGVAILLILPVLLMSLVLENIGKLIAHFNFTLESISIILFGIPLRRWQVEKVRTMVTLRIYNKGTSWDVIAVSSCTIEELSELGKRHMPKLLQPSRDRWYGEIASKYLYRQAISLRAELNRHKHILWIESSPERLKLLRKMYPDAIWLDGTEKKLFDAQLK